MRINPVRKSILSPVTGQWMKLDTYDSDAFAFLDGELEIASVYHTRRDIEIMDPTTGEVIHTIPKGRFEVKANRQGTSLLRRHRIDYIADVELAQAA